MLVNVDQPGESKAWVRYWSHGWGPGGPRGAKRWGYLLAIFRHNAHENRAYNPMARLARGRWVTLVQDDDGAPEDCGWVHHILSEVAAHPRTVVIGYNNGAVFGERQGYWQEKGKFAVDGVTGKEVNYDLLVDVGPMSVLRSFWVRSGGFDNSWGRQSESGILSDWGLTVRAWAAGQRVRDLSRLLQMAKRLLLHCTLVLDSERVQFSVLHYRTRLSREYSTLYCTLVLLSRESALYCTLVVACTSRARLRPHKGLVCRTKPGSLHSY